MVEKTESKSLDTSEIMSVNFEDENEVKQYLDNIGIEYRFGCYSEKKPDGNMRQKFALADLLLLTNTFFI